MVRPGNTFSAEYTGYLGQTEFIKGIVLEISDSMMLLSNMSGSAAFSMFSPIESRTKSIRYADLKKFRRMSVGRQLIKSITMVTVAVGSYILIYNYTLTKKPDLLQGFVVSLGLGLATKMVVDWIFPEQPKYAMAEGWKIAVLKE